jgi:hypothetical protein
MQPCRIVWQDTLPSIGWCCIFPPRRSTPAATEHHMRYLVFLVLVLSLGCTTETKCPNPALCDDLNSCTKDTCDPLIGCQHTKPMCDDGNPCTQEKCMGVSCTHTPISEVKCNDGDPCTKYDFCVEGKCFAEDKVDPCDDGDPCTWDACGYPGGCSHFPQPCS